MDNKPMLSVERDLIERAVQAIINTSQMQPALNELRALLDKPVDSNELSLGGSLARAASGLINVLDDETGAWTETEALKRALEDWSMGKPAAQHQGEIDLEPGRLAHAENVIEQQNSVIASLRAELVDGNSHAPKQQGEPVAELQVAFFEHAPMATINWFTPSAFESGATKLYTEQPAPVAVAHTMRSVMEAYEAAQKNHLTGTSNFCAAMAARLNGV